MYPQNYAAHALKAQYFNVNGNYDQAIQAIQEALKSSPNHPAYLHILASAYHQKSRQPGLLPEQRDTLVNQALNLYLIVAKHDPYNADLYFKIGHIFESIDQPSDAIDAYNNAILVDPYKSPEPFSKLATIYSNLGFINEAFLTAKAGLSYHPDVFRLTLTAAQSEFSLKRYDEALTRFAQAADLFERERLQNLASPPPSDLIRQVQLGRALTLTAQASALIADGRPRAAAKLFDDAAAILNQVIPQVPKNAFERRSIEIKRQWLVHNSKTLNQVQ